MRGHALVYFLPRTTLILDSLYLLSCACQRGPFQGWLVRRLLLPYLPSVSRMVTICPVVGLFIFIRCVSNTLAFQGKYWGPHSVFEGYPLGFWCPTLSGGGSEVSREFSDWFRTIWLVCTVRSPQGSLLLSPDFFILHSGRSYGGILAGSCLYLSYLWWQGLQIYQIGII